jgi:putative transposase
MWFSARKRRRTTNSAERHTEEQVLYALRQMDAGKKVGEICREMGVSTQAFYRWKSRF